MKKIFLMMLGLLAMSLQTYAQGLTATLQSGESFSAYYGIEAFKQAYEAAKDGDQITLSAGTFNVPSDALTKGVRITGVGAFETTGNTVFQELKVGGSNVRIEGVKFSSTLYPSSSTNIIVTRCWVEKLDATDDYTNPLFSECVIKSINSFKYARGFTIKNCTINYFTGDKNADAGNMGSVLNCVIYNMYNLSGYNPFAIYRNNLIGFDAKSYSKTIDCASPSEYYDNVGFSKSTTPMNFNFGADCINVGNQIGDYAELFNSTESYPANPQNAPDGDDGTPVGPYGGTGFSPYPAVPRILSKTIDGSTNDEGKINVKVEVKAEQ